MPFEQGSPTFGLNDGKVQTWASAGTYSGTLTDIMSIQMGSVTMELVSAILTGDDRQTAIAALAIGGTIQMRFGGLNPTMMGVLTGKTPTVISSVSQLGVRGSNRMPYIGIILKALSAETGDTWLYLPKCKIISNFTFMQMEYGAFATPEVTLQIVDDDTYGVINVITHPTDLAITVMPPANIAAVT